ncbi:MAG: FAD-dependent oxidoreductase [Lachnospiraceae bacterium]|nr:FAD-dependent oxidoreductase [Lachnospiraceae bacterium]
MKKKTVIIGGVAAGASCAARLRRMDEDAEIILIEKGPYVSFANCGLPYHIGGDIENREDLFVVSPAMLEKRFKIDVRTNQEVISIDRQKKTVTVLKDGVSYEESYDALVIATGSSPFVPSIPGIDHSNVFTIWNVQDMDRIRTFILENDAKSAVVVGGGFIGLEMAENLKKAGLSVSLVEMQDQVMVNLDPDMAHIVETELKKNGVSLYLKKQLAAVEEGNEKAALSCVLNDGARLFADIVIMAAGVRPNSKLAEDAGLKTGKKGGIVVDRKMRTEDPSIYACGDVVEVEDYVDHTKTMIPLAGPANKQGRICANVIAGLDDQYEGSLGTSIVRVFGVNAGSVGKNMKQLEAKGMEAGRDYFIAKIHPVSHASYYPGAQRLTLKMLYAADGKILGASAVGKEGVDKRIDVIATAMHFNAPAQELKDLELAYAPPFSSAKDPVNMLGFIADNKLRGICDYVSFEELEKMDPSSYTLLDVRSEAEMQRGMLEHAVGIPVDALRDRYQELDKEKPLVIYCGVGIRAYIAARILKHHGFECLVLSGSWTTYKQLSD